MKKCACITIPKGNMGYDRYTVPDTVAVEPTFVAFPLALVNISLWPLVPFFQISLKNKELKTTPYLSGLSHALFPTINLSRNSCINILNKKKNGRSTNNGVYFPLVTDSTQNKLNSIGQIYQKDFIVTNCGELNFTCVWGD